MFDRKLIEFLIGIGGIALLLLFLLIPYPIESKPSIVIKGFDTNIIEATNWGLTGPYYSYLDLHNVLLNEKFEISLDQVSPSTLKPFVEVKGKWTLIDSNHIEGISDDVWALLALSSDEFADFELRLSIQPPKDGWAGVIFGTSQMGLGANGYSLIVETTRIRLVSLLYGVARTSYLDRIFPDSINEFQVNASLYGSIFHIQVKAGNQSVNWDGQLSPTAIRGNVVLAIQENQRVARYSQLYFRTIPRGAQSPIHIEGDMCIFKISPFDSPALVLAAIPWSNFTVKMDFTVKNHTGILLPFRFVLFSPSSKASFEIRLYSSDPDGGMAYFIDGQLEPTPIGEPLINGTAFRFGVGKNYHLEINYSKNNEISAKIGDGILIYSFSATTSRLLKDAMVNVAIASTSIGGTGTIIVSNLSIEVLSQAGANYFDGNRVNIGVLIVAISFLTLIIASYGKAEILRWLDNLLVKIRRVKINIARSSFPIFAFFLAVFLIHFCFMGLGIHPFDMYCFEIYSYLISQRGLSTLYPLSSVIPSGRSVNDVSMLSAVFPYPPLSGYVFGLAGFIATIIAYNQDFSHFALMYIIKSFWVISMTVSSYIIYKESRSKLQSTTTSLLLAAIYMLNPAVILESDVWGQFGSVLAMFVTLCAVEFQNGKCRFSWFFLMLAVLTKPQAILLVPFLFVASLRLYGLKKTISSVGLCILLSVLLLSPYLLCGYSPWFITNITSGEIVINIIRPIPRAVEPWQLIVSYFNFNIWTLITALVNGATGLERFTLPDYLPTVINIPYVTLGIIFFVSFYLFVLLVLIIRERIVYSPQFIFIGLSLIFLSMNMLLTRTQPRYLVYIFPLMILAVVNSNNRPLLTKIILFTFVTSFISLYFNLILESCWNPRFLPAFHPNSFLFNQFLLAFFSSNLGISFLSVLNITNLAYLTYYYALWCDA